MAVLAALHWVITAAVADSNGIASWSAQGLLAAGLAFLGKEYRDEKNKREALNEKMLTEVVPLLTQATEAVERISFLYRQAIDQPAPPRRPRSTKPRT